MSPALSSLCHLCLVACNINYQAVTLLKSSRKLLVALFHAQLSNQCVGQFSTLPMCPSTYMKEVENSIASEMNACQPEEHGHCCVLFVCLMLYCTVVFVYSFLVICFDCSYVLCLCTFFVKCLFVFCTWRREPRPRMYGHWPSPSARRSSQLKGSVLHIHILQFKYFMHSSMLYKFCFPSIDRLFIW